MIISDFNELFNKYEKKELDAVCGVFTPAQFGGRLLDSIGSVHWHPEGIFLLYKTFKKLYFFQTQIY